MSEVLEMVNRIVEASTDTGSPQLPLKSLEVLDTSSDTEAKNKRRIADLRGGEIGWFTRIWKPKLLRIR